MRNECQHIPKPEFNCFDCPNLKLRKNDKDWFGDNYDCEVCGKHVWLDYEEMK